jgi:predicted dehydrogenase
MSFMMDKVLIWGLGSIGLRHYENFSSLGCKVAAHSARLHEGKTIYSDIDVALNEFAPDYVVIANETSSHAQSFEYLLKNAPAVKRILVEKPLYAMKPTVRPVDWEKIRIAYNMRFHPLLIELRSRLGASAVIGWTAYVGQNLANWRPNRDYRQVYSSKKEYGGGAIRDLSHEIDMFQFITGKAKLVASHGGKFSKLDADTDDQFALILQSKGCGHAVIQMNCIDHLAQRKLTVHTNDNTYELDFVNSTLRDRSGLRTIICDRNDSYLNIARAFLTDDERLSQFEDGWSIAELIEQAEAQQ